jgi:hypothetical protein
MSEREITVVFYRRLAARADWHYVLDEAALLALAGELKEEYAPFGIQVVFFQEPSCSMEIKGYGDLLNSVRLRAPQNGIGNLCLGHIVGASPHRDLLQDIRRGVSKVAFAPETVEPEGSDKIVCHNCGCGC